MLFSLSFWDCSNLKEELSSTINDSTVANCTYFMPSLANANLCDTIKLTSGSWETKRKFMHLHKVAYGNLNGDNKLDAAVVLALCTGGSGIFISINALIDSNGVPFHRACKFIGDRIKVDSVFIQDQIINLHAIVQRYKEGACCPDSSVIWQFKLEGNNLRKITGATF